MVKQSEPGALSPLKLDKAARTSSSEKGISNASESTLGKAKTLCRLCMRHLLYYKMEEKKRFSLDGSEIHLIVLLKDISLFAVVIFPSI